MRKSKSIYYVIFSLLIIISFTACARNKNTFSQLDKYEELNSSNEEKDVKEDENKNDDMELDNSDMQTYEVVQKEDSSIYTKIFDEPSPNDKYKNIAIFCVDSTTGMLYSNTKSKGIMIVSANERTEEIKLVNVQHLTYWNIDGDSKYRQALYGYYGGPQEALDMINRNMDLAITDFITIGIDGLEELADSLGGVDAYIDADELEMMNDRQYTKYLPEEMEDNMALLQDIGIQRLDGIQTVVYCMGNLRGLGDSYMVAERQQEIATGIALNMMSEDEEYVDYIFDELYTKYVYTSLEKDEYQNLVDQIRKSGISKASIFPTQELSEGKTLGSNGSCLCPTDLGQSVTLLHQFLFSKEEYQPSTEVQNISDEINEKVAEYAK